MRILQFSPSPRGGALSRSIHAADLGLQAVDPPVKSPTATNESRFIDTRPTATPRPQCARGVQEHRRTIDTCRQLTTEN